MSRFENLRASSLYCNKCAAAMPVREKLLLVLPDKEIYEYLCTGCASSVGQREVSVGDLSLARASGLQGMGRSPSSSLRHRHP